MTLECYYKSIEGREFIYVIDGDRDKIITSLYEKIGDKKIRLFSSPVKCEKLKKIYSRKLKEVRL